MKELDYEDWQKNPTPRKMWVWDDYEEEKVQKKVLYILFHRKGQEWKVSTLSDDETCTDIYKHCAEIEKQRRMTSKELSRWLSEKPYRELKMGTYIYHDYDYEENEQDAEVTDFLLIREDDGEWKEPLVGVEE